MYCYCVYIWRQPKNEDGDHDDNDMFESADDDVASKTEKAFECDAEEVVTVLFEKYLVNLIDFFYESFTLRMVHTMNVET